MDKKCKNCEFARYTVHDGRVGCAYWSVKYYQEYGSYQSDEKRNSDMLHSGLREAWVGWVYLKRRPEILEPTLLGEGMMNNHCVITNENAVCKKFDKRN